MYSPIDFSGDRPHIKFMTNAQQPEIANRCCNRCKNNFPATVDFFVKDSSRPLGIAYECRSCHSQRRAGRDRRRDRWSNFTPEQRLLARERNKRYSKTPKGRAIYLRKAYERVDSCDLSTEEIMDLVSQPCFHCGTTDENRGLDRIDNSLPHIRGNVVPSCAPCNFARGDRFTFEEMKIISSAIRQVMRDRKKAEADSEDHQEMSDSTSAK